MKRAIRRAHRQRLKNKRKYYYGWGDDLPLEGGRLGVVVNTPTVCSCAMCGNPRRHHNRVTKAEKINLISFIEQLDECGLYYDRSSPRKGEQW